VRLAGQAFQAVALAAGLAAVFRIEPRWPVRIAVAMLLAAWFWPWYRAFDAGSSLLMLGAIAWMLAAPGPRRYVLLGVVLGLVALVGRNHGLYGGLAALAAIAIGERWRDGGVAATGGAIARLAAGCALGYLPMLVLLGTDAAFRDAFVAENLGMLRAGATNIALPVPWPHVAIASAKTTTEAVRGGLLGLGFVALPAFALLGAWRAWRLEAAERARAAPFVAAVLLVPMYAHLAFSRADLSHLASSIAPLLVGLLAWPGRGDGRGLSKAGLASLGVLLAATAILVVPRQPGVQGRIDDWQAVDVRGTRLHVPRYYADQWRALSQALHAAGDPRDGVLLAPNFPGGYAAFGLRAPNWENYALFARDAAFEEAEIARLRGAGLRLAVVEDHALDGRDDLRYRHTHPRIHAYLQAHAERIERKGNLEVFHLRGAAAPGPGARAPGARGMTRGVFLQGS
jgi:hypothetical protein